MPCSFVYLISEKMKEKLRKPFGKVIAGRKIPNLAKRKKIICVGDYVTRVFLNCKKIPDIAVVDFKTKRKKISKEQKSLFLKSFPNKIFLKNQKGTISKSSIYVASLAKLLPKPVLAIVNGEEDLVALPFIASLQKNSILVYGIMNKGAVFVLDNASKKAKLLLKEIEKENKSKFSP